ncbi:MAG TPA: transglycosylase domain-containing protein [Acidimicrobiales bacterium]|nr:transglycosylase domain-containing protein [Acidimicrobiales bacterium]
MATRAPARRARNPDDGKGRGSKNPKKAKRPADNPDIVGGRLWRLRRYLFVVFLLGTGALAVGLYKLTQIPLPSPHPLAQTSYLYDSSGKVLASFSAENRTNVPLSQVPQVTIDAVVSTEDRHFFTEGAVNPVSIVRAMVSDVAGSGNLQGASTITQQYVKQTYLDSKRTLSRKIKEAALSIRVSRVMSKNQILQGYLNTIYWGRGAYGIDAAAETYFGVPANQLDLKESAILAGMIREPDSADPTSDPTVSRQNQLDTLRAMVRDHKITQAQATAAEAVPFRQFVKPPSGQSGATTRAPAGENYFIEAVRQQLVRAYGSSALDGGGLRVYTTLDTTLQNEAYNAVYGPSATALNPAAGTASGAMVSMDNNGEVKALVGGQDYKASTVNLALGAAGGGGGRQSGSTFKGIMLAELIKLGYTPASVYPAPPEVVFPGGDNGRPYKVTNFEHEATNPQMSIVDATALSVNTVYVQVADKIGPANLDAMAAALGISRSELGNNLSEVLGTDDVSPLEMTAAYATFADNGIYHAPLLITKVTNAAGKSLPLPVTPVTRQVLTPAQDAELTYVLEQVVLRGTGVAAGQIGSQVAGKTGTTDNSANAWFIGYTPNITTGFWMGYASGFKPMTDYRWDGQVLTSVQGGTIPATLWHNYMAAAIASEPQLAGSFPPVYYLAGSVLTPPSQTQVQYPEGFGSTTTSSTSVPTSSTTAGKTTTTRPSTSTTVHTPPTTSPPTTSPPTTVPHTTTTLK